MQVPPSRVVRRPAVLLVLAPLSLTVVSAAQVHPTQPGGVFCRADLDRDGVVGPIDLGTLLAAWG